LAKCEKSLSWCPSYAFLRTSPGSIPGQVYRSLRTTDDRLPLGRRSTFVERSRLPQRPPQNHGISPSVYAGKMRHGGEGRRKSLSIVRTLLEAEAVSPGIRRSGCRLPVLQGSFSEFAARGSRGGY